MRPIDVKKLSYRDELARKNRLFFILKLSGFVFGFFILVGGGVYFMFFTDKLEIKNITINGLQTLDQGLVAGEVNKRLKYKKYGHLHTQKNVLFFDTGGLEADLLLANPVLKAVRAKKVFPHKLEVDVLERKPAGVWCSVSECRYFDLEMETWGQAARSSGFLFLIVEDRRPTEKFEIDKDFFDAVNELVANLSEVTIKSIIIPENSLDEFRAYTDRRFYLIFSLDSDIKGQAEVLKIFLDERAKDPNFASQYLDLRTEGRIYYK